ALSLLNILAARRGRPVPREQLIDLLWPGQDPGAASNRLSVAQAAVRSVLDPGKHHPADHFVPADAAAVALSLENVWLDADAFLTQAEVGLDLYRRGRIEDAVPRLAAAEAMYAGDFLEEDGEQEWAVAVREEARAACIAVTRALAQAADPGDAAGYYRRILERDAYDEQAHLGLVACLDAAGRGVEARRAYRGYCTRMEELGVESAAFPAPVGTARATGP
ncbi:MAG: AfsR/SARP family transcriptional regulator, partial [Anaerolineales bacterium]